MPLSIQIQQLLDDNLLDLEQSEYLQGIVGKYSESAFWYINNQNPKFKLEISDFWFASKFALQALFHPAILGMLQKWESELTAKDLLDLTEAGLNALRNKSVREDLNNGKLNTIEDLNNYDNNLVETKIEYDCDVPDRFICPITGDIMSNPVFDADQKGSDAARFEEQGLLKCLHSRFYDPQNPMTRESYVGRRILPDTALKTEIETFKRAHQIKSITLRYS